MEELNHIKVVIGGEVYELMSAESEEHVQDVANYIDKKIKEIYRKKSSSHINHKLKVLFISLNIADDLFKEKDRNEKLQQEVQDLKEKLDIYLEENIKLSEENKLLLENMTYLQDEMSKSKRELNEYIENFDGDE